MIQRIVPDFNERQRERKKIRTKCEELKNEIDEGGLIYTLNAEDRSLEYLSRNPEKYCVQADNFLHNNTNGHTEEQVRFTPLEDNKTGREKIKQKLDKAIEAIESQNKRSKIVQYGLIASCVLVIGVGIGIGLSVGYFL